MKLIKKIIFKYRILRYLEAINHLKRATKKTGIRLDYNQVINTIMVDHNSIEILAKAFNVAIEEHYCTIKQKEFSITINNIKFWTLVDANWRYTHNCGLVKI